MKKSSQISLVAICAIVALAFGFLGAGLQGGFGGGKSASAATAESWIDAVKARGELRVGVAVTAPLVVQDGSDWTGPYLLPAENLATALGVKFVPVGTSWTNIVSGLQAGQYDMAASLDLTVARALSIQYTSPVMEEPNVFVVPRDSAFTTSDDILASALPITFPQGTTQETAIKAKTDNVLALDNYSNALQAVKSGRASASFAGLGTAVEQVKSDPSLAIVVPSPAIMVSTSGYGVPADIDSRSLGLINIAISDVQTSGAFNAALSSVGYLTPDSLGDLVK